MVRFRVRVRVRVSVRVRVRVRFRVRIRVGKILIANMVSRTGKHKKMDTGRH